MTEKIESVLFAPSVREFVQRHPLLTVLCLSVVIGSLILLMGLPVALRFRRR